MAQSEQFPVIEVDEEEGSILFEAEVPAPEVRPLQVDALERAAESLVATAELPEIGLARGYQKREWVTERLLPLALDAVSTRLIPYLIELAVARIRRSLLP
jgi:hypothetical protein